MKISADWRVVRGDIFLASLFAAFFGAQFALRLGYDLAWGVFAACASALLLLFLWPMIRDLAVALARVLAVRSSRGSPAPPSIPAARRIGRTAGGSNQGSLSRARVRELPCP